MAAVIYHQLGSLAVLLNSMRLLWFERGPTSPTWLRMRATAAVDRPGWSTTSTWTRPALAEPPLARRSAVGVAVLLLAGYALSGLTQVGPDEVAVVRRFGRRSSHDLGPGLYWRWPWPVEDVIRVQPDRVHTVEIGFRARPPVATVPTAWSSPHGGDGIHRVPDEAVMITGDGNLVELQATVRYADQRTSRTPTCSR